MNRYKPAHGWHVSGALAVMVWIAAGASGARAEDATVTAAAISPTAPAPSEAQAKLEEQREAARKQLDGSRWAVELVAESDRKTRHDTMTFSGRTVSSEWLTKDGFGASNFSLRFEDETLPVWETMQVSESKGTAFLKGEMNGQEKMSGVLSRQTKDGQTANYYFSATKEAAAEAPPSAGAASASAAPAESATAAPAKKEH